MNWNRHMLIIRAACLALATALVSPALAQEWPAKPIHIIVPFPPGQGADIIGRLVADQLGPVLGQPIVVENRPGAGSMVGTSFAAKSPADGYTLLIGGTSAIVINPHLFRNLDYKLADFAPVTNIALLPMIICVANSVPAHSIQELIALAKQHPGELTYGSSGNGSTHHLVQALFASAAGISINHVPYKGSAASMTDLISGRITMLADVLPAVMPSVRSGKVRALGITSSKRSPFFPELPTVAEQGVPGYEAVAWAGLLAPAGTPDAVLQRLNVEVVKLINTPESQKRFHDLSMQTIGDSRADFAAFLDTEYERWGRAVKVSGATVD
ncbi:MAG TPA: tripartite tricarboxylate transporter substrate binding protein [Burkholderiales bacterium]|nr:tripartite tricarboxylate transporter substrate binding protein [Burkholderiales bacterium]